MTFSIPLNFDRHLGRTKRAIEELIKHKVITSFDSSDLKTWLKNFETDLDRYLASQLLDFLVIRSNKMLESMCRNAVEHTVMGLLRELKFWKNGEYEATLQRIVRGDRSLPFRFVVIEDFGNVPAKSGSEVFRIYKRSNAIHKDLAIRHQKIQEQSEQVKLFILLDDFSGTGTQFCKFSKEIDLQKHSTRFVFAFVPLMAHNGAYKKISEEFPFVKFYPVETLSDKHNFFSETSLNSGIWSRDKVSRVEDVKQHYFNLLKKNQAESSPSAYNLNLAVGFDISTPNNTLKIFWTDKGTWKPLLKR